MFVIMLFYWWIFNLIRTCMNSRMNITHITCEYNRKCKYRSREDLVSAVM